MKAYYCDTFNLPLPEKHRFPMIKYRRLRERIEAFNQSSASSKKAIELVLPPAASDAELMLAHDEEYVRKATQGMLNDKEVRAIGFPWTEALIERSRRSSGATMQAAVTAISDGISVNLAGGTHHACYAEAQGFCVFNDSAITARYLQQQGLAKHPLIIDLDVHQGNGTANILQHDQSIFTLSVHGAKNFPTRKEQSDLDVPLDNDCNDADYLEALDNALSQVGERFDPDFVIYVAGADPYENDRLGKLSLTKQGLKQRDERVFEFCKARNIPASVSMAGGYANDVEDIVDIHLQTVMMAYEHHGSQ
ncbi:histone deacetylase family protein [Leucothrix pacifica]|uniref:Histone deacetylase n=1 Tax=Leucothrix pacifica TaxID=1247513 RepID=A0A317C9J9_9GAMM|nr:histone deacetylase [Leucothrix pacifica]PWQ95037.1 histone deacetylase [Leucothrix pacifica]